MTDQDDLHREPDDVDATVMPEPGESESPGEQEAGRPPLHVSDPFATFTPADGRRKPRRSISWDALVRGDQIGDFRIQRLLGRGSFGAVYLARELTLDRLVAVKVVLPEGKRSTAGEGRSLARLKHPNIVGVFGEAHDTASGCSLLWMQFVDGCNLAGLIKRLNENCGEGWNDSDFLRLLSPSRDSKEPEGESGKSRGSLETVCRIGEKLALAVNHAHSCGIAHRDIKPANILMQVDGTPLLADFNLADNARDDRETVSGGTIAYMPPEQFAQVMGEDVTVDANRADIYSLGVVLWELASGCRPHARAESSVKSGGGRMLLEFLRIRREELPPAFDAKVPIGLEMILKRAMAVDPQQRYPSASAMATALSGLEEMARAQRRAPSADRIRKFVREKLFWIILIGGILPHLVASAFQSYYNLVWIISPSGEGFKEAFGQALVAYNVVVYPACVGWLAWNLYRFAQGYRPVVARQELPRGRIRKLRGRLLRLPRQFMIMSAAGWFPGIVLFPWLLGVFGHQPSTSEWFHLAISFAIAGLIATTYSYAIVLYVAVCHGYRACWQTASHYRERARAELSGVEKRIRLVSILVGVLPLAAAVLLLAIAMSPLNATSQTQMRELHGLLIALIVSGAFGLYAVETASGRLIRCVRALTLAEE